MRVVLVILVLLIFAQVGDAQYYYPPYPYRSAPPVPYYIPPPYYVPPAYAPPPVVYPYYPPYPYHGFGISNRGFYYYYRR